MKRLLGLAALSIGMMVAATTSHAGWPGCYIGANAGMSATNTDSTLDIAGVGTLLAIDGLGSSGRVAGLHAGCDVKIQQFVAGAFADYQWHSQSMDISVPLAAINVMHLDIKNQWTIGGRAGIAFSEKMLVYGLVGWTKMQAGDLSLLNAGLVIATPTFQGWSLGGGIDTEIMPNVRLGVEYRYTLMDKADLALAPGLSMGVQPEMHTATARLSYAFSFDPGK